MRSRLAAPPTNRRARSGAVLILFVMLVFVFLAVAGVVIDMGVAHLTQAQMQAATDSAALEGCRWRNFHDSVGTSHRWKRRKAAGLVRLAFDDDLHPTLGGYQPDNENGPLGADGPDERAFAAGPGLRVSGGAGAWQAHADLGSQDDTELARLDDPRLEVNDDNRPEGDMVAGRFLSGQPNVEHRDYSREDFTPDTDPSASRKSLSFLVRMRRTGAANPEDMQDEVSSTLPTLPLLFGMGSTAHAGGWDPRLDGITVRATAIASARPAMRVGRPPCAEDGSPVYDHEPGTASNPEPIAGLMPFCLYRKRWVDHFTTTAWVALDPDNDANLPLWRVRVEGDGQILLDADDTVVGHFMFDQTPVPCAAENGWPEIVGRRVPHATSLPVRGFRYTTRKPAYIAIVEDIPDANGILVPRVIGYGFAHVMPLGSGPAQYPGSGVFVIRPGDLTTNFGVDSWIAQDNASAVRNSAADESVGPALSAIELREVLRWSNLLAYGIEEPDPAQMYDFNFIRRGTVLAPALTR